MIPMALGLASFVPRIRPPFGLAAVVLGCSLCAGPARGEDVIELLSGAKVRGKITSRTSKEIAFDATIGSKTFARKYPIDRIHAVTINGQREVLNAASGGGAWLPGGGNSSGGSSASGGHPAADPAALGSDEKRTRAQVEALINQLGKTPPEWYDATPLNYPKTLDLTWPMPAPGGWNNQQNMGQFIWDIINPNPGRWREGVKLMHYLLSVNKDNRTVQLRVMNELGRMYHNLLEDYARAAFWWRQAGVDKTNDYPASSVHLAESYWRLGNQPMADELLAKVPPNIHTVKLLADMGETAKAVQLAEAVARGGNPHIAYMLAGDAYRIAGNYTKALEMYQKVLNVSATGQGKGRIDREHGRAWASIEAIQLFQLTDVKKVPDGTYRDSSLGYEGPVDVEVVVRDKRIESVRVTDHKEKQFYSALSDTPKKIIKKQGVQGVDATSGATITSEAIINATAKALAGAGK